MTNKYLHTNDLSVGYNGKALISRIALDIQKGEIVTLIGPNGSGKSTILKSLTRQLKLIGGSILLEDSDIMKLSRKEMATRMSVVLTERVKPELMTCRDIVASGRYPYTGRLGFLTEKDEQIVSRSMELMRVTELENRSFSATSDGQKQRVLLARAVCQEPEIIVLDEPTSYLDIRHKLELLTILRDMAKDGGITIVMSLHEIDLAQKISDRIICVKGDTIALMGSPEEVITRESIRNIYEIETGVYDPIFGSLELAKPEGEPEVFVLCGNGTGAPIFRTLQKKRIPFAAGILYENDIDYCLARSLATQVIAQPPFTVLTPDTIQSAERMVRNCRVVINGEPPIGDCNRETGRIIELARSLGKLKEIKEL